MFEVSKVRRKRARRSRDRVCAVDDSTVTKISVTSFASKCAKVVVYQPKCSVDRSCSCFILLTRPTQLALFGRAKVMHLCGPSIHILGGTMEPNLSTSFNVFSSTSHTPISIKQSDDAAKENAATRLLSLEVKLAVESLCEPGDACSIIESLVAELDSFQNSASVLHFSPFSNRVLDSVTEVKRFRFLFHLPSEGTVPGISLAHSLGFNFLEHDGSLGYQVVPEISNISVRFGSISVDKSYKRHVNKILICGPKGAGKSSLLRFLSNTILTDTSCPSEERRVAILDCDVGQPEFTPSGMISLSLLRQPLFGPPFTHLFSADMDIIRQCFVGSISPSDDPNFYLKCLEFIFEAYMNLPEPKPRLIVNTMGWIQGLGLTLLLEQILLVRPELIIQLHFGESSSNRTNSVDLSDSALKTIDTWNSRDISNEIFTHDVLLIESKAKSSSHHAIIDPRCHLGPPDHRDLTMLTYFMSTLSNAPTSLPSRLMHEPLGHPVAHVLDCIPYQVPVICSSKQQDICGNNTVDDRDCSMFNNRISVSSANQSVLHTTHSSLCSDKKDQIQLAFRVLKPKSKIFKEDSSPFLSNVDDLLSCLNATLVALCVVPQDIIKEPDSTCLYRWISCNPVCECVGLAVCRAIDPVAGVLYLTTGVPEENLLKVTGILRGNVNLPNCFFLDQPFFRTKIDNEACILPYLGPSSTKGKGRVGLPSRRSYPKTMHHDSHRIGTSETIE